MLRVREWSHAFAGLRFQCKPLTRKPIKEAKPAIHRLLPSLFFLALLLILASGQLQAQIVTWSHPLSLPYGDVTYDEWVKVKKLKPVQGRQAILKQLSDWYERDPWAAYIASELYLDHRREQDRNEHARLLRMAADQGNPLAQAMFGFTAIRFGDTRLGNQYLGVAESSGHPRAITLKAMTSPPDSQTQHRLKKAADFGDEMAELLLLILGEQTEGANDSEKLTSSRIGKFETVAKMPGLMSSDPLIRTVRAGNEATLALFFVAQRKYLANQGANIQTLRSVEKMLLDVSTRTSPLDFRHYWMFNENVAARAHGFLAHRLYGEGPLKDSEKELYHTQQASNLGDKLSSRLLATKFYHPTLGLKPNRQEYFRALELAVQQGGVEDADRLAREYLTGESVPKNPTLAIALLAPYQGDTSAIAQTKYGTALLAGDQQNREEGLKRLSRVWEENKFPEAARALSDYYALDRSNPNSQALALQWLDRAFHAYTEVGRRSVAGLAFAGVGLSISYGNKAAYKTWRDRAFESEISQKERQMLIVTDVLIDIEAHGPVNLSENITILRRVSTEGYALADLILGVLSMNGEPKLRDEFQLDRYQDYFDRALQRDKALVSRPLIEFLLPRLGFDRRAELLDWLNKTTEYHREDEKALKLFLEYSDPSLKTYGLQSVAMDLIKLSDQGSGFAAGYIAHRRMIGDKNFSKRRLDDVALLHASVSSPLPYPDSFALLSDRYLVADGVSADKGVAANLLKRGAEAGSGVAMLKIARASMDGTFERPDLRVALTFAKLAASYGVADALVLQGEIERLIEEEGKAEKSRIEHRRMVELSAQIQKDADRLQLSSPPQPSGGGSSFFSGLGSFLLTLLEIGLIVGLVVLTSGAIAGVPMGAPGMAAPPPAIYSAPARVTPVAPPPRYQSVGLPDYSSGRTAYHTTPSVFPAGKQILPSSVQVRSANRDPALTARGTVGQDGSFTARNVAGETVRGAVTRAPGGNIELQVSGAIGSDPAARYRGELGPSGTVTLRNPYTGKTVSGNYELGSEYQLR